MVWEDSDRTIHGREDVGVWVSGTVGPARGEICESHPTGAKDRDLVFKSSRSLELMQCLLIVLLVRVRRTWLWYRAGTGGENLQEGTGCQGKHSRQRSYQDASLNLL